MQIPAGGTPTGPVPANRANVTFQGNLFDRFRNRSEDSLGSASQPQEDSFRSKGSVGKGILRTLHKSFLRPRGWLELASLAVFPVPVFQIKHFLEGYLGYNSLFLQRRLKGPIELGMAKSGALHDKPILEALKERNQ